MTRSSATNTCPTVGGPPDTPLPRNSIPGREIRRSATRNAISRGRSAGRVADQLDAGAVPPELDDALQPRRAVGVGKCDGVTGALARLDAVEPVGVRHPGGDELAEVK